MNVEVTEKVTVVVGDTKLRVQRLVISGLPSALSTRDARVDGIIGYALLNSAVVVVDYPAKRVTLIESDSFNYQGKGESVPLSLSQGWASVGATLLVHGFSPAYTDYWINTGMTPAITDYKFSGLVVPSQQSSRESSSATHNHVLEVGQFEYIELGKLRVDNLGSDCCIKAIFGGPQIGVGLLKNFIVTFDYPHRRLILERPH